MGGESNGSRVQSARRAASCRAAALVCAAGLASAGVVQAAEPSRDLGVLPGDVQLTDVVEIQILDRNIIAYDVLGSGRRVQRLLKDEEVLWSGSKGRVGIVITTRRLLGTTPGNSGWIPLVLQVAETRPERADLGERIALVQTNRRLLGFDSASGRWSLADLGPGEQAFGSEVGEGTAVVVTGRRALGLGASGPAGFVATPLRIHEQVQALSARPNLATVTTSQRVLVFRGPSGSWTSTTRPLP